MAISENDRKLLETEILKARLRGADELADKFQAILDRFGGQKEKGN